MMLRVSNYRGASAVYFGASAVRLLLGLFSTGLLSVAVAAQEPDLAPASGSDPEGVETLTQGPIHEAFANPTDLDPTPGPIVMRQPPPDIQEEPPEYMSEGAAWIGGYWVFDEERDDFIWVTGVARKTPPGMRYLLGYWSEVDGGWQRVAGFWMNAEASELAYRPTPPDSLEAGPSSPAPADNYFWVPGNWTYYDTGFRWRAGYWSPYQPDWVWCPARWVWTPGGFVYLPGFWDFRLNLRGEFFAPIYFRRPVYLQPQFVYRPWCVIPTGNLFIHLWIRPQHCHYYFGNYYGPTYAASGFHAWCDAPRHRRHYDPLFTYASVHYRRQGIDYVGRVQGWHQHFDKHEDHRPARTWHEQVAQRQHPRAKIETQLVARNIVEVAERNDAPVRLTKLDNQSRQAHAQRSQQLKELNTSRRQVEREAAQVVAKLPKASDAESPERTTPETRGKRGPETAKTRSQVAPVPTGAANLPKFKLPKDPLADVSTTAARPAESKAKGNAKGSGESPAASRGKVAKRDNIPPPMPSTIADDGAPSAKAKGKAEPRVKGRQPQGELPAAEGLPERSPVVADPPAEEPGKTKGSPAKSNPDKKNADNGNTGKGNTEKGKAEPRVKGRQPQGELPSAGGLPERSPAVADPPADEPGKTKGSPAKGNSTKGNSGKGKSPKVELPKAELPTFESPKAERPKVESPKVELPKAEPPPADAGPRGKASTGVPREIPSSPRIETPKSTPRLETPKDRESSDVPPTKAEATQPAPRLQTTPPTASNGKASVPRSSKGRGNRDKEKKP